MKSFKAGLKIITFLNLCIFVICSCTFKKKANHANKSHERPRIIVSTDIGGTDPDDNQSMIHLLMYSDLFQIEGLISSPSYGQGSKEEIWKMIDLYEQDLPKLRKHSSGFPSPDTLRAVTKQGVKGTAPFPGYRKATEGSEWIVKCAKKESDDPLWVLVWGGLEDLAQALHDAPEIKEKIKVYWIGGPNKKWSVNAYAYIASTHPDLWMIEANATYRGWFMDEKSPENLSGDAFFSNYIQGHGAMGEDFINYYNGKIKMGDTPSLAYLMNGQANDPTDESWGGSFVPISQSSRIIFNRNTTLADTVAAYAVLEWRFQGPALDNLIDSACFTLEISNQLWPGYYLGKGIYSVRYSSKKPETCTYKTSSSISELNGLEGQFVSTVPWPGKIGPTDYITGENWYSDRPESIFFIQDQQGAVTVAKFREQFLMDWAKRWEWLK